jgi:Holliday junction resolvase
MTSNKRRGTEFERRVRKWYEEQGALVVRSAGSFGPADLVVIWKDPDHKLVLVSCRLTGREVGDFMRLWKPSELDQLKSLAADYRTRVVLAWKIQKKWGLYPYV